jgi:hypothetical protein
MHLTFQHFVFKADESRRAAAPVQELLSITADGEDVGVSTGPGQGVPAICVQLPVGGAAPEGGWVACGALSFARLPCPLQGPREIGPHSA